jgi:hypothetical protein
VCSSSSYPATVGMRRGPPGSGYAVSPPDPCTLRWSFSFVPAASRARSTGVGGSASASTRLRAVEGTGTKPRVPPWFDCSRKASSGPAGVASRPARWYQADRPTPERRTRPESRPPWTDPRLRTGDRLMGVGLTSVIRDRWPDPDRRGRRALHLRISLVQDLTPQHGNGGSSDLGHERLPFAIGGRRFHQRYHRHASPWFQQFNVAAQRGRSFATPVTSVSMTGMTSATVTSSIAFETTTTRRVVGWRQPVVAAEPSEYANGTGPRPASIPKPWTPWR